MILCVVAALFCVQLQRLLLKKKSVTYLMFNGPVWNIELSIIIFNLHLKRWIYGELVTYLSWSVWELLAKMT